jgi:hypothetical protein
MSEFPAKAAQKQGLVLAFLPFQIASHKRPPCSTAAAWSKDPCTDLFPQAPSKFAPLLASDQWRTSENDVSPTIHNNITKHNAAPSTTSPEKARTSNIQNHSLHIQAIARSDIGGHENTCNLEHTNRLCTKIRTGNLLLPSGRMLMRMLQM